MKKRVLNLPAKMVVVLSLLFLPFISHNEEKRNSCEKGERECMEMMKEEMHHGEHMKGVHEHKNFQEMKNPVEKTPKSLYEGRILFEKKCASCHGKTGKGDTSIGKSLNPPAADLTDNVWKHGSTEGEIFHVISEGVPRTGMSSWKNTLTEEERWKLVNFIKCLQEIDKVIYQCPMHPEVKSNLPDRCPKCGMFLERQEKKEQGEEKHSH